MTPGIAQTSPAQLFPFLFHPPTNPPSSFSPSPSPSDCLTSPPRALLNITHPSSSFPFPLPRPPSNKPSLFILTLPIPFRLRQLPTLRTTKHHQPLLILPFSLPLLPPTTTAAFPNPIPLPPQPRQTPHPQIPQIPTNRLQ